MTTKPKGERGYGDRGYRISIRRKMIRWEHRAIQGVETYALPDRLHEMEVLGWELVSAVGFEHQGYKHYTLFFKRLGDED